MSMFWIREAHPRDANSLQTLAEHLGPSGSIPQNIDRIKELIETSQQSFSNPETAKSKNKYLFVLEDYLQKKLVGCSLIFAKHGTPDSPHTFLRLLKRTREDPSTQTKVDHELLRFEFDKDGPSEIGGLILDPLFRASAAGLGRLLSYCRFVYMGIKPEYFEPTVIAELLPPFNEDGSSPLWEAFGRRFTGMSYQEADRLSRTNKNFITSLFPNEDIYTCLFDKKAQDVIGKTGQQTTAAKRLLEHVGFTYMNAVDPFDGGPHYEAKVAEISLVKRMKQVQLSDKTLTSSGNRALLGFIGKSGFGCLSIHCKLDNEDGLMIEADPKAIVQDQQAEKNLFLVSPV